MIVPRPYQQESINKAVAFLTGPKVQHGVVVAPTGCGKSVIIAGIVDRLDGPCLVFQPSKEILEQNAGKLEAYGYKPAIFSASLGQKRIGEITLATIGSVVRHVERFRGIRYVLIDECHQGLNAKGGIYTEFLAALENIRILGLTATPFRLSVDGYGGAILKFLTRTRPRVFSEVVHVVQIAELYAQGYLAKLQYLDETVIDTARLKPNSNGSEYSDLSIQNEFAQVKFHSKLAQTVDRLIKEGRRVLVFVPFVEDAAYLARVVPGVEYVSGETPKNTRAECLRRFKYGSTRGMANCGVLVTGFDYPELDTVVLGRPTMSLALHYQMIGRALRPHPAKPFAMIVDTVGLMKQFGGIEDLVVEQVDGKWAVTSKGKQLTNVYYGEQGAQEGLEFVVADPVLEKMVWSEVRGMREARATPAFWAVWRMCKDKLKENGISVQADGEVWTVKWKRSQPAPLF